MKIYFSILLIAFFAVSGCGKAGAPSKEAEINSDGLSLSEADSILAESADLGQVPPVMPEVVIDKDAAPLIDNQVQAASLSTDVSADSVSIQKALKNSGLYEGAIDGKVGPRTKAAIREFQRKNNLNVDGKVGPKTWALLSKYLQN